jgi:basic amino acid/polyamine antiporter, APA family
VGVILGAGIFVVVGPAAALAGGAVWLPFVLGALAAACTGLTYAELASAFPRSSAAYEYAHRAFGFHVAFVVGWLVLFSYIVSASAVALGFAGYVMPFLALGTVPLAVGLMALCAVVLLVGIRESVWIGGILTLLVVMGLLVLVGASTPFIGDVDLLEMPQGMTGVFQATAMLFFAYLGFEQVANLGEEAKNPARSLPIAIILSVAITSLIYSAVAVAAISVVGWETLSRSAAPLAEAALRAGGPNLHRVVSIVAWFATANTVLFVLLAGARIMYGMAASGSLPRALSAVQGKTGVPWVATLVTSLVAVAFVLPGDLGLVVQLTNVGILAAFVVVNGALVRLRLKGRRGGATYRAVFRSPLNIANVPISAVLGIAISLFMLANLDVVVLALGALIAALGAGAHLLLRRLGKKSRRVYEC